MTQSTDKQMYSHYFVDGKPVHQRSFCAFLDVLGFSERILACDKNGRADELLGSFHQILAESIAPLKKNAKKDQLSYFKSFTDNVVLACPDMTDDMDVDDMEFASGIIFSDISRYQLQMALKGFFIRGGLALGPLFMDENSVYGSALIEAHRLESKVAINPCVVLCDKAMRLVDEHIGYYYRENPPQRKSLLKGQDGRYFVNYLSECINDEYRDREHLDVKSLRLHKEQIELALKNYAAVPTVFSKFSWLAAYHNYFCGKVSDFSEYEDSLKVSTKLADFYFRLLTKKKKPPA